MAETTPMPMIECEPTPPTAAVPPAVAAPLSPADASDPPATFTIGAEPSAPTPSKKSKVGPGGKHDHMRVYDAAEAARVHELIEAHKPRWTYIAEQLTKEMGGEKVRTAASVRNYYKRFQESKKIAERDTGSKKLNRCQKCGQIKRGHICVAISEVTNENASAAAAIANAAAAANLPPVAPDLLPVAPAAPAIVSAPEPAPEHGHSPLALSSADAPMPPLADACLEHVDTASLASGTSPFSGFSAGLPSASLSLLGSPSAIASPTALAALGLPPSAGGYMANIFARQHFARPAAEMYAVADIGSDDGTQYA